MENLNAALEGGIGYGPFARDVMESTSDFEEAIALLYNASFMAPQYFVMSGNGKDQGAVLTIDRLGKHKAGTPKIQSGIGQVIISLHQMPMFRTVRVNPVDFGSASFMLAKSINCENSTLIFPIATHNEVLRRHETRIIQ